MNNKFLTRTDEIYEVEVRYKQNNEVIFKGSIQDYLLNYCSIVNYKPKKSKLEKN